MRKRKAPHKSGLHSLITHYSLLTTAPLYRLFNLLRAYLTTHEILPIFSTTNKCILYIERKKEKQ